MTTPSTAAPARSGRPEPCADVLDAAVRLARIRQRMFARVQPARIAQYHVMRRLGGGAMGLVFAAWDPSLDRAVAIKVLREAGEGGGEELRAEAQALARLGHANVVTVFEVGEHDGQLYLAMEFIEGETLREWLVGWRAAPRKDWTALREVFVQVARGLAAAHTAGVVHRDVKPENIMIDRDGRVRVMDFGLARHRVASRVEVTAQHDDGDDLDSTLTRVCGTPAYMAPEQFEGRKPGPAADQFALGATLFEAIYGRRIRAAGLVAAMASASEPVVVPAERGVPRALRATLSRLLAVEPEARFASMDAVAAELSRQNQQGATRWAASAVAVVIGATGLATGWAIGAPEDQRCTGAAAQLEGIWDDATAEQIRQGLDAETSGLGRETWDWVSPQLDGYRDAWITAFRETCEAAQVRRELPQAEMDRRVACLNDRRRHLAAAVDLLRDVRPEVLARGDQVIDGLPGIDACADSDYAAKGRFPAPGDEAANARAQAIARAQARFIVAETVPARAEVEAALQQARQAEDAVAEAHALLLRGRIAADELHFEDARGDLLAAYELARRNELPIVASDAALSLSKVTSLELGRVDEGLLWLSLTDIEYPATGDVRRSMLRALARAMVELAAGHRDAALQAADSTTALLEELGDHPLLAARVRRSLAAMYLSMGRLESGVALAEQALREVEDVVGKGHPATSAALSTVALARRHQGDLTRALQATREQLAALQRGLGDDQRPMVPALESLANALSQTGATEEALAALTRADALLANGGDPITRARLSWRRGLVLVDTDPEAAAAAHRAAYDWAREAIGDNQGETVQYRIALAVALRQAGHEDEASQLIDGALPLAERVLGADHSDVATMRHELAIDAMHREDYEAAVEHYTRALAIWDEGSTYARAELEIGACAALTKAGRAAEGLPHCEAARPLVDRSHGVADGTAQSLEKAHADALAALGRSTKAE